VIQHRRDKTDGREVNEERLLFDRRIRAWNLGTKFSGDGLELLKIRPILARGLADLTGKAFETLILRDEAQVRLQSRSRIFRDFRAAFLCSQHVVIMPYLFGMVNHA